MKSFRPNKSIRSQFQYIDAGILYAMGGLMFIGLTSIYSSSIFSSYYAGGSPVEYLIKQMFGITLGSIGFIFAVSIPSPKYLKLEYLTFLLGTCILLLVIVLFSPPVLGASRWIALGPLSFQPSELTKIAFVLFLGKWFADFQEPMYQDLCTLWKFPFASETWRKQLIRNDAKYWKRLQFEWGVPAGLFVVIAILLKLEPDNGSIIVLLLASGIMFATNFLRSKNWRKLLLVGFVLVVIGLMARTTLTAVVIDIVGEDSHIATRFRAWSDPMADPEGDGYQLLNSYIAIAKGKVVGAGLGNGTQKQGFLPEGHTDFILANIAEEFGLLGIGVVLCLFFLIIYRMLQAAMFIENRQAKLMLIGLNTLFFVQVFWNAAGISGLLPMKGLTSPFLSYGGTSVLFNCLLIGLSQGIIATERRKQAHRLSQQQSSRK